MGVLLFYPTIASNFKKSAMSESPPGEEYEWAADLKVDGIRFPDR
jgi:hypothetical protein